MASPLPSRGSKRGRKCYVTPAFSGAQKRAEMLRHPCILGAQKRAEMLRHPFTLGDPQQRGTKSEVATSPLPSRGPKRGRKCYATLAFSGVPNAKLGSKSSKPIHGQFHIGDGPQRHHMWGEEAQKGKNTNKNRGKRVYRGMRYIKIACVYVPLYCLHSKIITQTRAAG